ncbi:MAG: hypothetical protein HY814_04385 [Candidatus Riflebacteria bacterium]|nr:hypothetical protein [Candidatus Riflebacteria bacterium]
MALVRRNGTQRTNGRWVAAGLLVWLLALAPMALAPAAASAQIGFSEAECGKVGAPVHAETFSGALEREVVDQVVHLLNPAYTGPGNRWDVEVTMHRTRSDWPWWAAVARIDVLSADGQSLGRTYSRYFKGTTTCAFSFYGETHEEARPHRIRICFAQPYTFPFAFTARVAVRPVTGANPGGPLREQPEFFQIGSTQAPSWMCGDVVLRREPHRFGLVYLQPGQELRAKLVPGVCSSSHAGFGFTVWNTEHRQLATAKFYVPFNKTHDVRIYRSKEQAARFFIIALSSDTGLSDHRIGFYSPQGASPAVGEAVSVPTGDAVNPYTPVARSYQTQDLATGAKAVFELPGTGELLRLRLRIQKPVFLSPAPGVFASINVLNRSGKVLARTAVATDPWGHEPSEYAYELDGAAADGAVALEITTRYNVSVCWVDAARFARR